MCYFQLCCNPQLSLHSCNIMRTCVILYSRVCGATNCIVYLWQAAFLLGPQAHLRCRALSSAVTTCGQLGQSVRQRGVQRLKSSDMPLTAATCAVICRRQQRQVQSKARLATCRAFLFNVDRHAHLLFIGIGGGQDQSKGN